MRPLEAAAAVSSRKCLLIQLHEFVAAFAPVAKKRWLRKTAGNSDDTQYATSADPQ